MASTSGQEGVFVIGKCGGRRKFAELEWRVEKLEDEVTTREYHWDRRFH